MIRKCMAEHADNLDAAVRRHVLDVLARSKTVTEAAERLGVFRSSLQRMLRRWGIGPRNQQRIAPVPRTVVRGSRERSC